MAGEGSLEAKHSLCVLKFGSSVLECEADYRTAAQEVYRHVREGEKIVAVVSALAGETDFLLDQAGAVGGEAPPALVARLARVGELRSAALMALALCRMGVRACAVDPHEMGLEAKGDPLDSDLCGLDAENVLARFDDHDVVVVPGFTAGHAEHGVVTLGRGGTDLSAVFFAAQLGSRRVRLLKDVDGVYAEDPAQNPRAERYGALGYEAAEEASAGLIQPKAIHAAAAGNIVIEVAAIGHHEATVIADVAPRKEVPLVWPPLKVSLLGCGAVGAGVLSYLEQRPDLFKVNPVLVRHPDLHSSEGGALFTANLDEALDGDPDLVIELIGGSEYPADIMCAALRRGSHVVTANKAAVARHYDALHACAEAGKATFSYSAAVGGGSPILETIARVRADAGVGEIEGVMNGTANFLLSRLGEGWDFAAAVAKAQELGFAEADPAADVDGHDAADKLSILIRKAFGVAVPPGRIYKQSLRDIAPGEPQAALARGEVLKQVGRCSQDADGSIKAEVRIEALPASHPLAGARNEENRFLVHDRAGQRRAVFGKGAGRWPSAAAVFADVMDLQRSLASAGGASAAAEPAMLRMSA
ncbi:homoserine dehydrogenase [Sphingosinicella sp. CPCC 101087]|uniref:homoserine dehydrogenase n=1 Tax=Sphingosinicella sp. CPCC 101087 TaxID=2497754 RepID=UPI00101C4A45|nr:homoserine dehydrogenase [Sphingosinicella sp. CPCC 101087]